MKSVVISAGVILCTEHLNKNYYLLVKDLNSKKWGFPKGRKEMGESLENTAIRELYEETNIKDVSIISYLGKTNYTFNLKNEEIVKTSHYFLAVSQHFSKIKYQKAEIAEAEWVNASEVLRKIEFEDLKLLFNEAVVITSKSKSLQDLVANTGERLLYNASVESDTKNHHIKRYEFATEKLDQTKSVLDVGCGVGYGSYMMSHKAKEVLGVDISKTAVNFANKSYSNTNLSYRMQDIFALNEKYDLITCFEVLEHLEVIQVPDFIFKLKNLLKPDGCVLLSTPTNTRMDKNIYHINQIEYQSITNLFRYQYNSVNIYTQTWGIPEIKKLNLAEKDFVIFELEHPKHDGVNLDHLDPNKRAIIADFILIVKETFKSNLVSVLMYGSQVYSSLFTKYSDYDFIIVLKRKYNDHYQLNELRNKVSSLVKYMYKYDEEISSDPHREATDYVLSAFNFEMKFAVPVYGINPYLTKQKQLNKKNFIRDCNQNAQMRIYWTRKGLMFYPNILFNRRPEFYVKNLFYDFQNVLLINGYLYKDKEDVLFCIAQYFSFLTIKQTKFLQKYISDEVDFNDKGIDLESVLIDVLSIQEKIIDYYLSLYP